MFNAVLKELQIRMTWCDRDSLIICTINGYKNSIWNERGPVGIMTINVPGVAFLIHLTRSQADNKTLMYSRRIKSPDLILLSLYPRNVNNIRKLCTCMYTKTRYCQSIVMLNDLPSCININDVKQIRRSAYKRNIQVCAFA